MKFLALILAFLCVASCASAQTAPGPGLTLVKRHHHKSFPICQAPGPGLTLIGTIPASGGQLDFSKSANSALIAAVH